jgi:hypothetical protein
MYFHFVVKYGTVIGRNSSDSGKILTLQKKIIRSMTGVQPGTSYRSMFKKIEMLPVPC